MIPLPTDKYKHCNHHHELTEDYEVVNMGGCEFVANKMAVPLLKALNDAGLITRSHHHDTQGEGFISIILDNVDIEIRTVNESDAGRTCFDGKKELLIKWHKPKSFISIKNNSKL
jgi:hypothetical protein